MRVGPGRVRLEGEHVMFKPSLWGWLRGARPMRVRYDHIRTVEMQRRNRAGRLVIGTTCAVEPFVLDFRRSQSPCMTAAAHHMAERVPPGGSAVHS